MGSVRTSTGFVNNGGSITLAIINTTAEFQVVLETLEEPQDSSKRSCFLDFMEIKKHTHIAVEKVASTVSDDYLDLVYHKISSVRKIRIESFRLEDDNDCEIFP